MAVRWSLNELAQLGIDELPVDAVLDVKEAVKERNAQVQDVAPVKVSGVITKNQRGIIATIHVATTVTLPSSRSLTAVAVPVAFTFAEYYVSEHERDLSRFTNDDVVIQPEHDVVDLETAVAENIVLHLPLKVLSPEEEQGGNFQTGDDWQVVSEEQLTSQRQETVDPRLAKLKDFFADENGDKN